MHIFLITQKHKHALFLNFFKPFWTLEAKQHGVLCVSNPAAPSPPSTAARRTGARPLKPNFQYQRFSSDGYIPPSTSLKHQQFLLVKKLVETVLQTSVSLFCLFPESTMDCF